MDVVVESVNELTRKLLITLPVETVQTALDAAYAKLKSEVVLKGFRKGKIPRAVLEKTHRKTVEAEVGEKLVQGSYFNAVEKNGVVPVVHPEVHEARFNDDGTFTYMAEIDVKPEVNLNQYKELEIERPSTVVEEAEVDARIEIMRREQAPLRGVQEDRPIQENDIVIVDFQGFHEGKAMPQVRNENYSVDVGTGNLGKEFEQRLIGMRKGEKTLHEVEFPADHPNPILRGKSVEFKVDVKEVRERVLMDLDDEFAKDVSDKYQTLDELRSAVREALLKEKAAAVNGDIDDRIMYKLLDNHQFPVPDRLVRFEIQEMIKQLESRLEEQGLNLEASGLNHADLAKGNRTVAERRVRGDFILKRIAEVEEIKLADEDVQRGYLRIAAEYKMSLDEVKHYFQRREEMLPFMNELHNEKILAFLRDKAVYIDAPAAQPAAEGHTA